MSASLLMMTEPLRAAVASRTLCSWYKPTDAAHTSLLGASRPESDLPKNFTAVCTVEAEQTHAE